MDFGAGTGRLAIPLAGRGYDVTAVEPCAGMLEQLEKKDEHGLVKTVRSKMEEFSSDDRFDVALCVFTVLLYLLDEEALRGAFAAAHAALEPGGLLFLDVPTRAVFRNSSVHDDLIERNTSVVERDQDLYDYREELTVRLPNGDERRYSDSFRIRYWPAEWVKNVLKECGFALEADLSADFAATGSRYYVMRRSYDTVEVALRTPSS